MMAEEFDESRSGTRERILEAAEALFAERGFESVSLRDITGAAEANVAAVNYYFGSKEKLIDAVVERHITPINQQRLKLLEEVEARFGEAEVPVEDILEAFLSPLYSHIASGAMSERLFGKFMGRLMGEQGYRLPESVEPGLRLMAVRFSSALRRAVPGLTEQLALWRMHYSFGVMAHTLTHGDQLKHLTDGLAGEPSLEDQFDQIIAFCAAGIRSACKEGGGAAEGTADDS